MFDVASVGLAMAGAALVLARLARVLHQGDAIAIALATSAGLLLADVVSAVAHWSCDTFFDAQTPILGPVIRPFRLHHRDPGAFRRHSFCERNRNNCLAALPLLGLSYRLTPWAAETAHPFLAAMLAATALALASATQIHAWAHDENAPGPVQWLQRCGVLLSPERHARHHRDAHDRAYGIVNGWGNFVLDRLGWFRRMETLAVRFGLRPASYEAAQGGSRSP